MDRSRMNTVAFERVSRLASNPNDPASIAVSLGATDLDITLVDNEVRKVLAALHGNKDDTYAGRTNDTPDGGEFLKKQLERLMKEKAQFKEKKLALLQLQAALRPEQKAEVAAYTQPSSGAVAAVAATSPAPVAPAKAQGSAPAGDRSEAVAAAVWWYVVSSLFIRLWRGLVGRWLHPSPTPASSTTTNTSTVSDADADAHAVIRYACALVASPPPILFFLLFVFVEKSV